MLISKELLKKNIKLSYNLSYRNPNRVLSISRKGWYSIGLSYFLIQNFFFYNFLYESNVWLRARVSILHFSQFKYTGASKEWFRRERQWVEGSNFSEKALTTKFCLCSFFFQYCNLLYRNLVCNLKYFFVKLFKEH